jgi:hypothetical protein
MVEAARGAGASANYAGSGGAIVGVLPAAGAAPLSAALRALGCDVIAPIAFANAFGSPNA